MHKVRGPNKLFKKIEQWPNPKILKHPWVARYKATSTLRILYGQRHRHKHRPIDTDVDIDI